MTIRYGMRSLALLLALVVAGGVIGAAYRLRMGVVTPGWLRVAIVTGGAALIVAVVLAVAVRG